MSIRQKIVAGLVLTFLILAGMWIIVDRQLAVVEKKVRFVENAEVLHNTILETRRYEKNFLLYGQKANLETALGYIEEARELSKDLEGQAVSRESRGLLHELQEIIGRYQDSLREFPTPSLADRKEVETRIRSGGKEMVNVSGAVLKLQHKKILGILDRFEKVLILVSVGVILLWLFLLVPVTLGMLKSLSSIQQATHRISMEGDFSPISGPFSSDETGMVLEAFNRMLKELEDRQEQLIQAKKLASLGILASGIAHQLNNPLSNISTSCQILMEEMDPQTSAYFRKLLNNIDHEVDRAKNIVRGLLEFSRAREFVMESVSIYVLMRNTRRLISSQMAAGVDLVLNVPEDLNVVMDAQRMQQVFLNLFMNSSDAMAETGGLIEVNAHEEDGKVEIRVTDNGPGIAEENLPRIFDPFFTTKDLDSGTGLGLAVAYGIVKKHGGDIRVESNPGQGATFIITLPMTGLKKDG